MEEKAFNLLDEPWIRVILPDCTVREVSLTEALTQAHTFTALAGEMLTQDVAVLRLLLAVLHTVFERVDETGQNCPIRKAKDAMNRWSSLWQAGQFPVKPIRDYLDAWHERFYLFHPQRPFFQIATIGKCTEYRAAKLNGEISESGKLGEAPQKPRLFANRAGTEKERLSYPEAARWLVSIMAFDDSAGKASVRQKHSETEEGTQEPESEKMLSTGIAWVGRLGVIVAQGDNLFETLMLNLVMLNHKIECWRENVPAWELDQPRSQERCKIPMPDNQAQLLTLQSRRILLLRDENQVVGYKLLGGDFFEESDAFSEQMTLWRQVKGKGSQPNYFLPKRHDASKQIWREFSAITSEQDVNSLPGVVYWQRSLKSHRVLSSQRLSRFQMVSVQYGSSNSSVKDVFTDTLGFHLDLLTDLGKMWREAVNNAIDNINAVAQCIKRLGENIEIASGVKAKKENYVIGSRLEEQFYDRIDIPFRQFLLSMDPNDDDDQLNEQLAEWRRLERQIALQLAQKAAAQAGPAAFIGRWIETKSRGQSKKKHYSLPEAMNQFQGEVKRLLGD